MIVSEMRMGIQMAMFGEMNLYGLLAEHGLSMINRCG
jgi:hypothetical protein